MNFHRFSALFVKERRRLFRDPFNILVGIVLPLVLLVLMGCGLSFDIKGIRLTVVAPERTELVSEILARFRGSAYFSANAVRGTDEGAERVRRRESDACLFLPQNLSRGNAAEILIVTNASNPQQARMKENYIRSVITEILLESETRTGACGAAEILPRQWFNEAGESIYFLIPGLLAIILTLIGALLTSMLTAQEYERGNAESLFVSPMKSIEMLAAKALNNFLIGITGTLITLAAAKLFFGMPVLGNVGVLLFGCALYLLMSLAAGLLISGLTKSQFIASELTIIVTLLPSILLSGYVFEISDLPAPIRLLTCFVPARYFIDFLQTVLLAGNYWKPILFNLGVIALFAAAFTALAVLKNPKRLDSRR